MVWSGCSSTLPRQPKPRSEASRSRVERARAYLRPRGHPTRLPSYETTFLLDYQEERTPGAPKQAPLHPQEGGWTPAKMIRAPTPTTTTTTCTATAASTFPTTKTTTTERVRVGRDADHEVGEGAHGHGVVVGAEDLRMGGGESRGEIGAIGEG